MVLSNTITLHVSMKKTHQVEIISLLLIGSILRLAFFWQPSFTGDEANHMMKAVSVSRGISDFVLGREPNVALQNIIKPILEHNHPPLEFLVLLPAVPFQPREFSARFIYVFISLITLIAGFFVVHRYRGPHVALAFLALFSTSSFLVWFSQMITFGLNLSGGVFISLGILSFTQTPNRKTLVFLILSQVFTLLVSVDFLLFVPIVLWVIISKRVYIKKFELIKICSIGILLLALYYFPYITYSFLPTSPKGAGFIHYKSYVTTDRGVQIGSYFNQGFGKFLLDKWQKIFSLPGVWTIWPWVILPLLASKKRPAYLKSLYLTLVIIAVVEIPTIPCCTVYLNLFGPLLLLAAEGIALVPRFSIIIIIMLATVQLVQSQPILRGIPNPITFQNWQKETDRIKEIGQLVKPCFKDDETYISTEDAWRTRYYFGRPMLPAVEYEMTTDELAVEQFLRGDLPQIAIIHIHAPLVSDKLLQELQVRAKHFRQFANHRVYFFKDCPVLETTTDTLDTSRS